MNFICYVKSNLIFLFCLIFLIEHQIFYKHSASSIVFGSFLENVSGLNTTVIAAIIAVTANNRVDIEPYCDSCKKNNPNKVSFLQRIMSFVSDKTVCIQHFFVWKGKKTILNLILILPKVLQTVLPCFRYVQSLNTYLWLCYEWKLATLHKSIDKSQ